MVPIQGGDAFHKLVDDLGIVLGPSSGIDDVDTAEIISLMERYTSSEPEWTRYALGDSSRSYTRNLVDEGNGKSNLLILVWTPGRGSAIHDHGSHCVMKILRGELRETVYEWPDQKVLEASGAAPPAKLRETTYGENQVAYISDKLGIHRVENPSPSKFAVSLHLYTPPDVAKNGCHIFNPRTGAPMRSKGLLYSEFGRKCKA